MTYIDRVARDIFAACTDEDYPDPTPTQMVLYRIYAVLCLAKGEQTTLEDVHDAWSAWMMEAFTGEGVHRSVVPFGNLTEQVREYDRPYMNAIHQVSRELERG